MALALELELAVIVSTDVEFAGVVALLVSAAGDVEERAEKHTGLWLSVLTANGTSCGEVAV